jgi:NAD(P)H-hydrate repair Nnr-like enzyme with NAD(P)H-hydrate epimerase domain
MFQPLYTADEMRAAEQGHDVGTLMERAGRAVAEAVLRRYPEARRIVGVCGKGANGGDGRIALRVLEESGRETSEELEDGADLVIDALFGTGFHGEPRPEATVLIERINSADVPVVAVDLPSGVDASTGEVAGAAVRSDLTVTMHGSKVGLVVAPAGFWRARSRSRTSASRPPRPCIVSSPRRSSGSSPAEARETRNTPQAPCSSSEVPPG